MIEQKQEWPNATKYVLVTEHSYLSIYLEEVEKFDVEDEEKTNPVKEAWINGVWVDEDYRHQGYATKLLNRADEIIKASGYNKVYIQLDFNNDNWEIAKKMFLKRGFETIDEYGTMVNNYLNNKYYE
jgi:ribosomal protein S18 acetylase RimI-like enzyme